MAYRVVVTDKAEADIESILKWFDQQSATQAGARWYAQFVAKLETLENHPERCPIAVESVDIGQEIRELLLGRRGYKYRVFFKMSGRSVVVLRVWHGSRDSITGKDVSE